MSEMDAAISAVERPSNFLALAITSMIIGFFPLGVVSTVWAARVDGLWIDGRRADALNASRQARIWAIASLITAAVFFVLVMVLILIAFLGVASWQSGS